MNVTNKTLIYSRNIKIIPVIALQPQIVRSSNIIDKNRNILKFISQNFEDTSADGFVMNLYCVIKYLYYQLDVKNSFRNTQTMDISLFLLNSQNSIRQNHKVIWLTETLPIQ